MDTLSYLQAAGVEMHQCGHQWKGLCPLHEEANPSFYVYDDGHWHCYSCGNGGDLIGLVRRLEFGNLEEKEAWRRAYDFVGEERVADPRPRPPERKHYLVITPEHKRVMDWTAYRYHEALLKNERAMAYLLGRGVTEQVIEEQWIGWCPGFSCAQLKADCAEELDEDHVGRLEEVGIIGKKEDGTSYERLWERVVIPERREAAMGIADPHGVAYVVWMQGRAITDDRQPKYLNLPLPKIYYGIDRARHAETVVLVEGIFDALPLWSAGLAAVCLLGHELKAEAVPFFRGKNVIICFDNDPPDRNGVCPGEVGARKAEAMLREVAKTRIVLPPPGVKDVSQWVQDWGIDDVRSEFGLISQTRAL